MDNLTHYKRIINFCLTQEREMYVLPLRSTEENIFKYLQTHDIPHGTGHLHGTETPMVLHTHYTG